MSGPATAFLTAVGHALELRRRPMADALVRRMADLAVSARLDHLLADDPRPAFRFRSGSVEYGPLPLVAFEGWRWAGALEHRGIGWLEIAGRPSDAVLDAFLDFAAGQMPAGGLPPRLLATGLRWGPTPEPEPEAASDPLREELAVMRQIFAAAGEGRTLPLGDAHAVAAALAARAEGDEPMALAPVRTRDRYQPVHAVNTALLALVMGEVLGLNPQERHTTAVAALLHDIGMAALPASALTPARFDAADRERVQSHAALGARLLLRHGEEFEEAAVVSYEHHLRHDGAGYPRLSYPREAHPRSRLVAVCDAFDALLAPRPDRPAREPLEALHALEGEAARAYDARIVGAFSDVLLRGAAESPLSLGNAG